MRDAFQAGCRLASLATAPTFTRPADLNGQMQAMFNDLGALGNVTSPGAFRGQAMNLYTGGALMMRSPGRNYPLVSAQLPSLRAGCGGIDLFGGSFSFINKQQFVALLQNIGANAVGYAFKLALQSISPDIDKLLTELQDQINKINAMNINSCEAAQSLVNGVVGEYDNSVMSGCANISQYLGSAAANDVKVDITINEVLGFPLQERPILRSYEAFSDLPEGPTIRVYAGIAEEIWRTHCGYARAVP